MSDCESDDVVEISFSCSAPSMEVLELLQAASVAVRAMAMRSFLVFIVLFWTFLYHLFLWDQKSFWLRLLICAALVVWRLDLGVFF